MNTGFFYMDLQASAYRQSLARSVSIETSRNSNELPALPVRPTNVYSRSISLRNGYNNTDWNMVASGSTVDPFTLAPISRPATHSFGKGSHRAAGGHKSPDIRSSYQSLAGGFIKPECLLGCIAPDLSSENDDAIYSQFTKCHTCYDLVPTSAKLVVFDTQLPVKKAFFALVEHGIRAAPLWDSCRKRFVGMLTITDFIHMLRRYYKSGVVGIRELEEHKIATWRDVLAKDNMLKQFITLDAKENLYEAVKALCQGKVHRLPITDSGSGNILYILTSKKILTFLYIYIRDLPAPSFLQKTPRELCIGSWEKILTLREDTKLIDALSYFLDKRVSALPVINEKEEVVAIYAKADVFYLAADKSYNNLDITVKDALKHRSDSLEGLTVCNESDSLAIVLKMFFEEKSHRVVIVDNELRVLGIISLSDVLSFLVLMPQVPDRILDKITAG